MKYVAHTVKGIEDIALSELSQTLSDFKLEKLDVKRIFFESKILMDKMPNFQTLDDLSMFIGEFKLKNSNITDIVSQLRVYNYDYFREQLSQHRELTPDFSVTVSIFKNAKIDKELIKHELAKYISSEYNLNFTPLDHSNFDVRISIEKKHCLVSIKVPSMSLFFRDYRKESRKGALRPSIAGAMIFLLTKGNGENKVVDNFCGSGTFLCEALSLGNAVYGGDISEESVDTTKINIATLDKKQIENIRVLDATNSKWESESFDIAVSNFPWNKQIEATHMSDLYSKAILEYGRILKPTGSIALLGYMPELMIKYVKKIFPENNRLISSKKIGYLGQTPTIVFSMPK